jgi:hypothetical protein
VLLARLTSWRGAQPVSLAHTRHAAALLEHAGPPRPRRWCWPTWPPTACWPATTPRPSGSGPTRSPWSTSSASTGCAPGAQLGRHRPPGRRRPRRLDDLERAVAASLPATSPDGVVAYINLASALIELGQLTRGFELQAEGLRMTERFGFRSYVRHLVAERVLEDYWRGRWDAAARVADEFVAESESGTRHQVETSCRQIRGVIRLARGDVPAALEDAAKGLALAREVGDPPVLDPSLAFHARASLAAGRVEEAGAYADELLAVLTTTGRRHGRRPQLVGRPRRRPGSARPGWRARAGHRGMVATPGSRRRSRWPAATSSTRPTCTPRSAPCRRGVRPPPRGRAAPARRPAGHRRRPAAARPDRLPPGGRHAYLHQGTALVTASA